jgi:hypothetical protein
MDNQNSTSGASKRTMIIVGVLIAVLGILFAFDALSKSAKGDVYNLSVRDGEVLAVTKTREAISNSAVDGSGSIDKATCDKLGAIAKKLDSKADWFSSCSFSLTGGIPDTSESQVVKLSDKEYCATFTFDKAGRTLLSYSFTDENCGSSRIEIK